MKGDSFRDNVDDLKSFDGQTEVKQDKGDQKQYIASSPQIRDIIQKERMHDVDNQADGGDNDSHPESSHFR